MKKEWTNYKIFMIILIILSIPNVFGGFFDNDIWHILCTGREIVKDGIPYYNHFFVKEGYKTIAQQWLYSVFVYYIYNCFSKYGILIFVLLQIYVYYMVLRKLLKLKDMQTEAAVLLSLFVVLCVNGYYNIRPEMITQILLFSEVYVIEKYKKDKQKRILYILPVITLAEMNLHMSMWIMHFVFLLPFLVPSEIKINGKTEGLKNVKNTSVCVKDFIIPVLLMAVTLFLNPYKTDGILLPFKISSFTRYIDITEMRKTSFLSVSGILLLVVLVVTVYLFAKKQITSTALYMALGTGLMSVFHQRHMMFFTVAVVYVLYDLSTYIGKEKIEEVLNRKYMTNRFFKLILILLMMFVITCIPSLMQSAGSHYAVDSVRYLKENDVSKDVKIYTEFMGAYYLAWNGYEHIYIGEKTEPLIKSINRKEDVLKEHYEILNKADKKEIETFIDKYEFDYFLVSSGTKMYMYLEMSDDYERVVEKKDTKYIKQVCGRTYLYKKIN